jgi:uncharacterized membrane protein
VSSERLHGIGARLAASSSRKPAARSKPELQRWGWIALGGALAAFGLSRRSLAGAGAAAGGAALIYRGATGSFRLGDSRPLRIERSVTVNRNRDGVFALWHSSERLPFLLGEVEQMWMDGNSLQWAPTVLLGQTLPWDMRLTEERPPDRLVWSSEPGSLVHQLLTLELSDAPAGRGTVVHLTYELILPGGALADGVGPLGRRLVEARIRESLRRFAMLVETGELPTVEGQPVGRSA